MQQPRIKQHLHNLWNAARLVKLGDNVLTRGFEVAENRGALTNAFEVINRPLNFSSVRNGQKVKHGVG